MKRNLILIVVFIFVLTTMNIFTQENVYKDDNISFKIPDGWTSVDDPTSANKYFDVYSAIEKDAQSKNVFVANTRQYIGVLKVFENKNIKDSKIYFYTMKIGFGHFYDEDSIRIPALLLLQDTFPESNAMISKKREKIKIDSKLNAYWEHWQGSRNIGTKDLKVYDSPLGYIKVKKGDMWIIMITEIPSESGQTLINDFLKIMKSFQ
jgi:hypothetical protein